MEIRLQGIGMVKGTQAIEIKLHDVLMWNTGSTSEVVNIVISKTGKTMVITTKCFDDWTKEYKLYERKMTSTRLVHIVKAVA